MRARDREDRFAGEYRRGSLFFCALFGFIFAAYKRTAVPPIDFPMSSVRGLKGVESEGKREREREGCRRTGNEGREGVRDQRVGWSSPAYLRPTQITERARASPLGRR